MNHSEFIGWLKGVEEEFPVTRWRVRGIRVWPLVRLSLSSATFRAEATDHGLGAGWGRRAAIVAGGLSAWARAYLGDRRGNRSPTERADAVFLTYSAGRRPMIEGRRYDPMSGPYIDLLRKLGQRPLVWEMSPFGDYNVPRYTPSFFLQPTLLQLRMRCQVASLGGDRVELDGYSDFLARVHAAGLGFAHADVTRIRRDVLYLRRLADRYASWLREVRPRWGFVTDAALPQQAFCLACRELGITSVELQHGLQGDLHPTYGSWFAVPAEGYETRARIFWNRDEKSAEAINRWAVRAPAGHVAVWGGDAWREMWMQDDSEIVRHTDATIGERKRALGGGFHILVTLSSQGDVLPRPLLEAMRSAPADWRFWLRLHPANQVRSRAGVHRVLGNRAPVSQLMEFATEAPLPALLRHLDCHLTVALSTVVVEAAAAGVPSVACGREAPKFFQAEIDAGMLLVATTPSEILQALQQLLAGGRRPPTPAPRRASTVLGELLDGSMAVPAGLTAPNEGGW